MISRTCGVLLLSLLTIAGTRSTRYSLARTQESEARDHRLGYETLVAEVQSAAKSSGTERPIVSNAQGLAWYALRRDVEGLNQATWQSLQDRPDPQATFLLLRDQDVIEDFQPAISDLLKSRKMVTVYESPAIIVAVFDGSKDLASARPTSP